MSHSYKQSINHQLFHPEFLPSLGCFTEVSKGWHFHHYLSSKFFLLSAFSFISFPRQTHFYLCQQASHPSASLRQEGLHRLCTVSSHTEPFPCQLHSQPQGNTQGWSTWVAKEKPGRWAIKSGSLWLWIRQPWCPEPLEIVFVLINPAFFPQRKHKCLQRSLQSARNEAAAIKAQHTGGGKTSYRCNGRLNMPHLNTKLNRAVKLQSLEAK